MSFEYYDMFEGGVFSNCCGARVMMGDICADCKEHCEAVKEDEEDEIVVAKDVKE
jgi:hypothetical protein